MDLRKPDSSHDAATLEPLLERTDAELAAVERQIGAVIFLVLLLVAMAVFLL